MLRFPRFQAPQKARCSAPSLPSGPKDDACRPEKSDISSLIHDRLHNKVELALDLTRFQQHFVKKVKTQAEHRGASLQTDQFLAAYRLAGSLVPGLPFQIGMEIMKELMTPGDRANFETEARSTVGGQIVRTEEKGALTLCTVTNSEKPGSSSLQTIYIADSGLSEIERAFIEEHEASHSLHGDSIASAGLGALSHSLIDSGATESELSTFKSFQRAHAHEQELRCDREAVQSLLNRGYETADISKELFRSPLLSPNSEVTDTHPGGRVRLAQISKALESTLAPSFFPRFQ